MSGCMRYVLDLEHDDEVFEAFAVPVRACRERAAQSVPFRTLVFHCWCQLMFVPHNHDMTSIDGVGQALPKWVPLLARLRLLE